MNSASRILLPVERECSNNSNNNSSQFEKWEVWVDKVLEGIPRVSVRDNSSNSNLNNLRTIPNDVLRRYRVGQSHLDHRILRQCHNRILDNQVSLWNNRRLVQRKMVVDIHHHHLVCLIMVRVVKKVDSKTREEEGEMVHHHHHQVLSNNDNNSRFLVMI